MRAAKVDSNHADIVKALRTCGASVQSLATVGDGCPDLAVGVRGITHLVEIKDGNKVPSAQELLDTQIKFQSRWNGSPVVVLKSVEMAVNWINNLR
jgi:Holliday junction resolvase